LVGGQTSELQRIGESVHRSFVDLVSDVMELVRRIAGTAIRRAGGEARSCWDRSCLALTQAEEMVERSVLQHQDKDVFDWHWNPLLSDFLAGLSSDGCQACVPQQGPRCARNQHFRRSRFFASFEFWELS
jgi:hypothetical protein